MYRASFSLASESCFSSLPRILTLASYLRFQSSPEADSSSCGGSALSLDGETANEDEGGGGGVAVDGGGRNGDATEVEVEDGGGKVKFEGGGGKLEGGGGRLEGGGGRLLGGGGKLDGGGGSTALEADSVDEDPVEEYDLVDIFLSKAFSAFFRAFSSFFNAFSSLLIFGFLSFFAFTELISIFPGGSPFCT